MNSVLRMMNRPLTSNDTDVKWGQIACWLASITVLVLGMFKLTELPLSEVELFFGVLLVGTVAMLGVLIGLVLPLAVPCDTDGQTNRRC